MERSSFKISFIDSKKKEELIPKRKKNYLKKVYTYWNDLRQRKIVIKSSYNKQDEKDKIKFFREILKKENI